jgi:hypothetical protein
MRQSRALNEDSLRGSTQTADFWSVNGVKQHDTYTPPAPHGHAMIHVGGGENVHTARYQDDTSRSLTIEEQIALLVEKSRTS